MVNLSLVLRGPRDVDALRLHLSTLTPPIDLTSAVLSSDGSGLIEVRRPEVGTVRHEYRLDGAPVRKGAPKRLTATIQAAIAALFTDGEVAA